MKYLKYTWSVVLLVLLLAACSLPEGIWTIDTRLAAVPTAWIGGPPMETEVAIIEATAQAIATEEAPQEESTPEPKCLVAGNIGRDGELVYHLPSGVYYSRVHIDPTRSNGAGVFEQWFCSPEQAEDAGFRRSLR